MRSKGEAFAGLRGPENPAGAAGGALGHPRPPISGRARRARLRAQGGRLRASGPHLRRTARPRAAGRRRPDRDRHRARRPGRPPQHQPARVLRDRARDLARPRGHGAAQLAPAGGGAGDPAAPLRARARSWSRTASSPRSTSCAAPARCRTCGPSSRSGRSRATSATRSSAAPPEPKSSAAAGPARRPARDHLHLRHHRRPQRRRLVRRHRALELDPAGDGLRARAAALQLRDHRPLLHRRPPRFQLADPAPGRHRPRQAARATSTPPRWSRYIAEQRISHVLWVPTMLHEILALPDLGELRPEPPGDDHVRRPAALGGGHPARPRRPSPTSTSSRSTASPRRAGRSPSCRPSSAGAKPGSAGRPSQHTEIKVVDDDGAEVPAGDRRRDPRPGALGDPRLLGRPGS